VDNHVQFKKNIYEKNLRKNTNVLKEMEDELFGFRNFFILWSKLS
jgi:hypothetical protein